MGYHYDDYPLVSENGPDDEALRSVGCTMPAKHSTSRTGTILWLVHVLVLPDSIIINCGRDGLR